MDKAYTFGNTALKVSGKNMDSYHVSILSQRTALLAVRKSALGMWEKAIIPYQRNIQIHGNLVLLGFQPKTGSHIGVWMRRKKQ